uniref:Fibronectin type III domain-containing protein n=1 Tax=candidate division WOR-3 bacterium TaxID=2052148 RepID=A0A7C4GGF2_UNCW3
MRLLLFWLLLAGCQDPFGFEPGDPTKPDPPGPPVLKWPENGEMIVNYAYPQDVVLEWFAVKGAGFYQVEVYNDSVPGPGSLHVRRPDVAGSSVGVRFTRWGFYYWRVRAASRSWNNYTAWSELRRFLLPDPSVDNRGEGSGRTDAAGRRREQAIAGYR